LAPFTSACIAVKRTPYGHFPFFEAPHEFAATIAAAFD
jgi:hypothetical protein